MFWHKLFCILAVYITATFADDDINFTLEYPDGKIVTGGTDKFYQILKEDNKLLESVPGYKERLERGYEKVGKVFKKFEAKEITGEETQITISNIFWDMYEEMFREAGLKLVVKDRPKKISSH